MGTEFEIPGKFAISLQGSVLAELVEPFVSSMLRGQYARVSIHRYVAALAHLARWMTQEGLTRDQLDRALIERFIGTHLPLCRCAPPATRVVADVRASGRRVIAIGRSVGLLPAPRQISRPSAGELNAFAQYLDQTRGLALSTRKCRLGIVSDFLGWRFAHEPPDFRAIVVDDLHRFLVLRLVGCSPGKAAVFVGALRSYLRFCIFRGHPLDDVVAAVPSVARWPLDRLPSVLREEVIQAVEHSFDLHSAGGLRDYAMFHLMLDLGLRLSEVASLRLDDFDWRASTLRIAVNKSRRTALLPLPPEVTRAVVEYLCKARPAVPDRTLFIRKRAPFDRPITLNAVRGAMRQVYARCGHPELSARTHVLRHTAASRMLRAGASLKRIADVLRHRCLDTTVIYTKVDTTRLASVAMPWPESRS